MGLPSRSTERAWKELRKWPVRLLKRMGVRKAAARFRRNIEKETGSAFWRRSASFGLVVQSGINEESAKHAHFASFSVFSGSNHQFPFCQVVHLEIGFCFAGFFFCRFNELTHPLGHGYLWFITEALPDAGDIGIAMADVAFA